MSNMFLRMLHCVPWLLHHARMEPVSFPLLLCSSHLYDVRGDSDALFPGTPVILERSTCYSPYPPVVLPSTSCFLWLTATAAAGPVPWAPPKSMAKLFFHLKLHVVTSNWLTKRSILKQLLTTFPSTTFLFELKYLILFFYQTTTVPRVRKYIQM